MRRSVGACLVAAFGGCGTANNLYKANLPGNGRVYGGVAEAANLAALGVSEALHPHDLEDFGRLFCGALAAGADVPLSAAADTLTLPITLTIAVRRWAGAPLPTPRTTLGRTCSRLPQRKTDIHLSGPRKRCVSGCHSAKAASAHSSASASRASSWAICRYATSRPLPTT